MKEFNAPFRILMGPGPSNVDPRIMKAMTQGLLSHMDPVFLGVMDDVKAALKTVFETSSDATLAISGTGTAGMETALVNMIEPGDRVLVLTAGYFADRLAEIAERASADVRKLELPWGEAFEPDQVARAIDEHNPRIVALVHVETSTGVAQSLEALRPVLDRDDIISIVDGVASLGGQPIRVDSNRLDCVYSGSQKCMSCPPGLAPITLSEKAVRKLGDRSKPVQSWYLDLSILGRYWSNVRAYHHTAPITLNYALREALRMIEEEGLENRYGRHRGNHLALVAGIEAMGLRMFARREVRAWTVNTVLAPEGIDEAEVRARLLAGYGIEIVGGLGPLKGRIWRVGLMGSSSTRNNVMLLLAALDEVLAGLGYTGPRGAGVAAAADVYRGMD